MNRAFDYFSGLCLNCEPFNPMLASDYPYTSGGGDDSADCLYSASKATSVEVSKLRLFVSLFSASHIRKVVKAAVAQQPVSAAIAVNNLYIHSYASGVIDTPDC